MNGDFSMPPGIAAHLNLEERVEIGKAARKMVGRRELDNFEPRDDARDPVKLLAEQDVTRVQSLLPIKYGRMLTSPFAFYRGAAALMADDLAAGKHTSLYAQLCGDAHLSNFGMFASPERNLVFDLNDFDETLPGPWEWDLKRLVASLVVAMRSIGGNDEQGREAARSCVEAYRRHMATLSEMRNLDVWYERIDVSKIEELLRERNDAEALRVLEKTAEKAYTKDSIREFDKLTEIVDGRRRIKSDPPVIVPVEDALKEYGIAVGSPEEIAERLNTIMFEYRTSLATDRRHLIEQYDVVHMARKVVGVGSVGTRVWIILMMGRDDADPLFMQVKEAGPSVLEKYLGESEFASHGERVVAGQRLMQAATDALLGWESAHGMDGKPRDFYVRQLKDWKGSLKIEKTTPATLSRYGDACGTALSRAHARSGDRVAISAYLGKSQHTADALAEFAVSYADQNERDYARMKEAVASGQIEVIEGV